VTVSCATAHASSLRGMAVLNIVVHMPSARYIKCGSLGSVTMGWWCWTCNARPLDCAQNFRPTCRIGDGTLVATNLATLEKQVVNADQLQLTSKIATQRAMRTWNEKRVSMIWRFDSVRSKSRARVQQHCGASPLIRGRKTGGSLSAGRARRQRDERV